MAKLQEVTSTPPPHPPPPLLTNGHRVWHVYLKTEFNCVLFSFIFNSSILKLLGMEGYKSSKRISVYLSMPFEVQTEGILMVSPKDDER